MSDSLAPNYGLIRVGTGKAALQEIPIPELRDGYMLVRTVAIALNPTDWTTLDAKGDDGTLVGCDYAGIVEVVGQGVTKPFKKGDRIAGFGFGGNDAHPETGAFARYIAVKGDIAMHIPDDVSFEAASTVGSGVGTTAMALHNILKLPVLGEESDKPVLIYGGSTATGTIAIQFAKLAGRKVITTCSPRNFDLVKGRGADVILDYHDKNVAQKIREITDNKLEDILDCVAVEESMAICTEAMGEKGGIYCNLLGIDSPRADIKSVFFLGYDGFGEAYIYEGDSYPARPELFEFAKNAMQIGEDLWKEGKWRPHPQRVGSNGLLGAMEGMQQMREGKYSGEKLVYLVDDTTWPQ